MFWPNIQCTVCGVIQKIMYDYVSENNVVLMGQIFDLMIFKIVHLKGKLCHHIQYSRSWLSGTQKQHH